GINDHSAGALQDSPKLSADGKTLWFTSDRPLGHGGRDIWFSSNSSGSWSAPANAGAPVNTAGDEGWFWFSPGSPDLYWNGTAAVSRLVHCSRAIFFAPRQRHTPTARRRRRASADPPRAACS